MTQLQNKLLYLPKFNSSPWPLVLNPLTRNLISGVFKCLFNRYEIQQDTSTELFMEKFKCTPTTVNLQKTKLVLVSCYVARISTPSLQLSPIVARSLYIAKILSPYIFSWVGPLFLILRSIYIKVFLLNSIFQILN